MGIEQGQGDTSAVLVGSDGVLMVDSQFAPLNDKAPVNHQNTPYFSGIGGTCARRKPLWSVVRLEETAEALWISAS